MAITSGSFGTSLSPQSNWTNTWAKANAQAKKMKSQTDYLSDLQERLYLPQIQHSPTVQLYSKSYRLAAARRHPKRKRLQKERNKPLQLPDIRQSWSLFTCETETSTKDDDINISTDPHLPPINKKSDKNKKSEENLSTTNTNKLPISVAVDYTNTKAIGHDDIDSDKRFFESPSYPARKTWKKQALYRRTLEPIKKPSKSLQVKACETKRAEVAEVLKEIPSERQKQKTISEESKEGDKNTKYRLQCSEQNIDDYRKEHDRKIAAARRIKAPPNSAKSVKVGRRYSKQYSEKLRRRSKQEKASTNKGNDDSGISSKTMTELKRKESRVEEGTSLDQINLVEVKENGLEHLHVNEQLTDTKREWIELWLVECENARSTWLPVPGDPNDPNATDHTQFNNKPIPTETNADVDEVQMPFGKSLNKIVVHVPTMAPTDN